MIKIVLPKSEIITPIDEIQASAKIIESIGRTSHLSDGTDTSAKDFIEKFAINMGHESMLEHRSISVRITCDRATSHQLVRHRLAAYTQESQRYCDYYQCLPIIIPDRFLDDYLRVVIANHAMVGNVIVYKGSDNSIFLNTVNITNYSKLNMFLASVISAQSNYINLRDLAARREDARSVLPNCAKTEVVATYNIRAWRHVFRERCVKYAQLPIRSIMIDILGQFNHVAPVFFSDIADEFLV